MERLGIVGPPHRGERGLSCALTGGSAPVAARPSATAGAAAGVAEIRFTA